MLLSSNDLRKAVRRIAWSFVLIHLNFYLFGIDLLANWVGYLLIFFALPTLSREESSASLLRPFAAALAVMSGITFVCDFLGVDMDRYHILSVFHALMWLYLQFQLLTNIAEMASRREYPKTKRILVLRSAVTVLFLVPSIVMLLWDAEWLAYAAAVFFLLLVLWICVVLASFSTYLWENEEKLDRMEEDRA